MKTITIFMEKALIVCALLCTAFANVSCSEKEGGSDFVSDTPVEYAQYENYFSYCVMGGFLFAMDPDYFWEKDDHGLKEASDFNERLFALADLQQKILNGEIEEATTRASYWSLAKGGYDFIKAAKNVQVIQRAALIGCAARMNLDRSKMRKLWSQIPDKCFEGCPQELWNTSEAFWSNLSQGKLDKYVSAIYKEAIYDLGNGDSAENMLAELGMELVDAKCRPIDLTLQAAGPLIEAGMSIVLAADDHYANFKLGYDIFNDNITLVANIKNGKLDTETIATAVKTNLSLILGTLGNITESSQMYDFANIVSGYSIDQVKDLNKEINKLLNDAMEFNPNGKISKEDLKKFGERAAEILKDKELIGIWDMEEEGYKDRIIFGEKNFQIKEMDLHDYHPHWEVVLSGQYKQKGNKITLYNLVSGDPDDELNMTSFDLEYSIKGNVLTLTDLIDYETIRFVRY